MAAIGKTLDLFEPAVDAKSVAAPIKAKPQVQRKADASPRKPVFRVAQPPATPPLAPASAAREELWLAIHLPQIALEALRLAKPIHDASPDSAEHPGAHIAQGSFRYITREIQQGSRRGFAADQISPVQAQDRIRELRERAKSQATIETPTHPYTPSDRLVVVDVNHNQQRVVACNDEAAGVGIGAGCGLNAAYALAGDLDVRLRAPAAEQRMLEYLGQWAGCFTSRVCLEPPDAVLLEVKGSLKLFGGHDALINLITTSLIRKNVRALVALAPTSQAALAFSRAERPGCLRRSQLAGALSQLPITSMRWSEEITTTLHAMGVQTIGDCLRLPREGFARRFGPDTLLQLDQMMGRAAQPRRQFIARERFSSKADFEVEIESHPHLLHAIEPMIRGMEEFLRPRQMGVQSLELRLRHRDEPPTRVVLRFVRPTADAAHCFAVVTERLERVVLPAPVIAAYLRSGPLWPLEMETVSHRLLEDHTSASTQAVARLIERLRARLGAGAVYGLQCIDEHRPELASRVAEPQVKRKTHRKAARQSDRTALKRPFWMLPQPQSLQTQRSWPYYEGKLELCQGPERIESGWWDGNDVSRDYYIARTPNGLRLWIYRERKSKQWFLHGVYG